MPEVLLGRHSKSYANDRNPAFGNKLSPLNPKGIEQAIASNATWREHGVIPEQYEKAILSSDFSRTVQSAALAGFRFIDTSELIGEPDLPRDLLQGAEVVLKHARERWVPPELAERRDLFFDKVRSGEWDYDVFMTHALFKAAVILRLEEEWIGPEPFPIPFHETRGFIPNLASVTRVTL